MLPTSEWDELRTCVAQITYGQQIQISLKKTYVSYFSKIKNFPLQITEKSFLCNTLHFSSHDGNRNSRQNFLSRLFFSVENGVLGGRKERVFFPLLCCPPLFGVTMMPKSPLSSSSFLHLYIWQMASLHTNTIFEKECWWSGLGIEDHLGGQGENSYAACYGRGV